MFRSRRSKTIALTAGLSAAVILGMTATSVFVGETSESQATAPPLEGTAVDEDRARQIGTAALEAFERGDYAGFSAHWDDEMKAAISEGAFRAFQNSAMSEHGEFIAVYQVTREPARDDGTVNFAVHADFAKKDAVLWLNFGADSTEVSGARLLPAAE